MRRRAVWIISLTAIVLLALLLLPACCCLRGPAAPVSSAPQATHYPPIGELPLPDFSEANVRGPTETLMSNVVFHYDETLSIGIRTLRGQMLAKEKGAPLNFDNRRSFILRIDTATIAMTSASLDTLMNQYVFAGPNSPLTNLHITMEGTQLRQEGVMHKVVDIPFTMWANVSADHGMIRLHPTKISICGINGLGLLKAMGQSLEKMLKMPEGRGVRAEENDLLLDPAKILPPPATELRLASVRAEGQELVQTYDAGLHLAPLTLPDPSAKNTMYFKGGTLRMGKLLMIDADMQVVDGDMSDPFDFFIDRYNDQLVAGSSHNQPNYGLIVTMKDFDEVAGRGSQGAGEKP